MRLPVCAPRRIAAIFGGRPPVRARPPPARTDLQEDHVMRQGLLLLTVAASAAAFTPAAAQRPGGRGPGAEPDTAPGVPAVEKISTTQHTISIDGKPVAYTARAGTMVLRDSLGKPKATVFYISYTRDQADVTTRPVTFFFNGGPGSRSEERRVGKECRSRWTRHH